MREQNANRWSRRLVILLVPVALVAAFAASGVSAQSRAGVIALASGDDQPRVALEDKIIRVVGGLGEGAFLGVTLEEETELEEGGARVTSVVDDSPAAAAGIAKGDVIVGFDGDTIRGPVALTKKIHTKKPGDVVSVVVVRDGSRRTLEATLGDRAERWTVEFAPGFEALEHLGDIYIPEIPDIDLDLREDLLRERLDGLKDLRWFDCDEENSEDCLEGGTFRFAWAGRPRLGVQLVEVTPELRSHMGAAEDAGVMVSKVISGTPAESAGVRVGDLIVALDGERVSSVSALRKALHDKTGKTFELEVIRDRTPVRLQVTIPEPENELPSGPRAWVRPVPRPARAPRAVPAVPAVPAPPAPAAAPEAVPAPPVRRLDVVRGTAERSELARAEVREMRERLKRERTLAPGEVREMRERLERERALARAEAREVRERRRESLQRRELLKRSLAGVTLL